MAVLAQWGLRRSAIAGDVLYGVGDVATDAFVVQSGQVAIVARGSQGDRMVRVYRENQLLGEWG